MSPPRIACVKFLLEILVSMQQLESSQRFDFRILPESPPLQKVESLQSIPHHPPRVAENFRTIRFHYHFQVVATPQNFHSHFHFQVLENSEIHGFRFHFRVVEIPQIFHFHFQVVGNSQNFHFQVLGNPGNFDIHFCSSALG